MTGSKLLSIPSVENEIKRYPDMKMEYVQIFREWLRKQPHLPKLDDDLLLLQFLRRCRYSIEKAKIKLDNYLTFRTHFPELTTGRTVDQPDMRDTLENWQHVVLPKPDSHGNLVFVVRLLTPDASKFHLAAQLKILLSLLECYVRENGTVPGYVLIIDAQNAGLAHLAKCTLMICKQIYFFVQKCCPASIKGVYSVNSTNIAETALKFFKSIVQGKMMSQIQIFPQGSIEGLYKYIPSEILPQEYGGEAGSMENLQRESFEVLQRGRSYITALDSLRVYEMKRRGDKQNMTSLFGANGTFKKLEVD